VPFAGELVSIEAKLTFNSPHLSKPIFIEAYLLFLLISPMANSPSNRVIKMNEIRYK
jgi:hypothetical protein